MQNRYLDILFDQSCKGVNRLFVLSFENFKIEKVQDRYKQYFLPTV